jgi:uncharacterized membrane protein
MIPVALAQILTVGLVMLGMDAVWLTYNAAFHRQVFAIIQGSPLQVRMGPAVLTYVIMIAAVWFFAVAPSGNNWLAAAGRGAAIGVAMYGVYDLTNLATLTKYPIGYAITDMIWGSFLCATVAAVATYFTGTKD